MANELRARGNLVSGTLSASLTNVATSMSSAGLANLPVIDTTNHAAITIENEIVWVTAHTAGATTATIVRAQEGTTAAAHNSGIAWQHGPTALDLSRVWNPPACRVYNNVTQNLVTGFTTLTFNTERYDTDNMHSTVSNLTRITFNTAGLYEVYAGVAFDGSISGERIISIFLNGNGANEVVTKRDSVNTTGGGTTWQVSTIGKFAVADFIEVRCYNSTGSTIILGAGTATSWNVCDFGATWVGTGS